jgi:hypothetical protein
LQRLGDFFDACPETVQTFDKIPEGAAAIKGADPVWQRFSNGRTMSADGLTVQAKVFFTILLARGSDPELAANFIKSFKMQYATITMPPLKFDRLLRAKRCFLDSIEGESLASVASRQLETMRDSTMTSVIYLEVASRALIRQNASILNQYYDEVEIVGIESGLNRDVPMSRPYISTSKFLLITQGEDNILEVRHCPSSRVLSLLIDKYQDDVEAVIQPSRNFITFHSEDERLRWVYKQILAATLGFANALWIRKDGRLHNVFKEGLLANPNAYVKTSESGRYIAETISPIASSIPEREWLRLGSSSRVSRIGGTVVDKRWEFEIVSINGVAELPPVSENIVWKFISHSAHAKREIIEFRFVTLTFDSESVRRIAVERLAKEEEEFLPSATDIVRDGFVKKEEEQSTADGAPRVIVEVAPTSQDQQGEIDQSVTETVESVTASETPVDDGFPSLTAEERILATSAQIFFIGDKGKIIDASRKVMEERGPLQAPQTITSYVAEIYALAGVDKILSSHVEWSTILKDDQKQAMRRLVGSWIHHEYYVMFTTQQKGDADE